MGRRLRRDQGRRVGLEIREIEKLAACASHWGSLHRFFPHCFLPHCFLRHCFLRHRFLQHRFLQHCFLLLYSLPNRPRRHVVFRQASVRAAREPVPGASLVRLHCAFPHRACGLAVSPRRNQHFALRRRPASRSCHRARYPGLPACPCATTRQQKRDAPTQMSPRRRVHVFAPSQTCSSMRPPARCSVHTDRCLRYEYRFHRRRYRFRPRRDRNYPSRPNPGLHRGGLHRRPSTRTGSCASSSAA